MLINNFQAVEIINSHFKGVLNTAYCPTGQVFDTVNKVCGDPALVSGVCSTTNGKLVFYLIFYVESKA
jgi:hypothetical protein